MIRRLLAGLVLAVPAILPAQNPAPCAHVRIARDSSAMPSPAPLDRLVTLHVTSRSLSEVLDRIAAEAKIRISYSSAYLPADRRICIDETAVGVGALLRALLADVRLEARPIRADHVVLTPLVDIRQESPAPAPAPDTMLRVQRVEPVIATAKESPATDVEVTATRTTISRADLARQDARSLATILNGSVPGIWVWQQGTSNLFSTFASLRGASSFGASSPKTYIDGIEVANPLLTTLLDADNIDRIDIIRGPQGSALFGADAMSGVVNITTRHEGSATGGLDLRMRGSAGMLESRYANAPLLSQDHSVSLRAGSALRSFGLSLNTNSSGAYVPGAESRQFTGLATARRVGSHSVLGATARLASASATSAEGSLFESTLAESGASIDSITRQSVNQYTVGFTAEILPEGRWTHTFSAGVDGYRLHGVAAELLPMSLAVDAALSRTPLSADRGSFRASSSVKLAEGPSASTTLTFSAEHTSVREVSEQWVLTPPAQAQHEGPGPGRIDDARGSRGVGSGAGGGPPADSATRTLEQVATNRGSTGAAAQLDVTLRERVHLTGGLRVEHAVAPDETSQLVALPMLGAAVVASHGDFAVKLRTAYGKGMRAPRTTLDDALGLGGRGRLPSATLIPEQQRGTEAGLEMFFGRALTLQVTRFDQIASGLVQTISLPTRNGRTMYGLGNVGEISNRGWEIEPRLSLGAATLSGALSFVDSRVRSVAPAYTGDLRPGDRMLGVPAVTAGLTLGLRMGRSVASFGVAHARDWMNYDMIALGENADAETMTGLGLRDYWRSYGGVTQLRASVSRDLGRGLGLVLTGENLLGLQRGAPDNATVLPGRTTTLGLRWIF